MNFEIPEALKQYLATLDRFIEDEIKPLEQQDDNIRFFDHRREWARTDFDHDGLPRPEWEALLGEARRRADRAGHHRFALPKEYGGQNGSNLWMAVIREYLAAKGLGLHNDLQNEHSIVGNHPTVLIFRDFGTPEQQQEFIPGTLDRTRTVAFGLTEPEHGSDATHIETRAVAEQRDGSKGWRIDGEKMWTTGMHIATHCMVFARTHGKDGDAAGITCFLVPSAAPGVKIEEYLWTFNMPTDHPRVSFRGVWAPETSVLGKIGNGLAVAQHFVHENRIRQAASSLGAGVYCIEESVKYARLRKPFGKALAENQAIQWPLVELATQAEMLRLLIRKTAWEMDQMPKPEVEKRLSDKVSMCNYWANRFCCEAADRAMQVHGGIGYSRHKPFEHIYRHHRRYRITEGSEEIQMRKIAGHLFGFMGPRREEFAEMERLNRSGTAGEPQSKIKSHHGGAETRRRSRQKEKKQYIMKREADHHWTQNDDLVAVYLYKYGPENLGSRLEEITTKLGMSTASMKMRIQNVKKADVGIGLPHTAKQTRLVFDRFGRLPERELRAKVERYLASATR